MAKQITKEQKISVLLSLFTPISIYNLKELEKHASKLGIRSNIVKDLINEMVGDSLITSDRIGTSNYFWKIPVSAATEHKRSLAVLRKLESERQRLQQQYGQLREERGCADRNGMIEEYEGLCRDELPFDVDEYKEMRSRVEGLRESVNRITEDIFVLQGFVCDKYGMDRKDFNSTFGIDDEMDLV